MAITINTADGVQKVPRLGLSNQFAEFSCLFGDKLRYLSGRTESICVSNLPFQNLLPYFRLPLRPDIFPTCQHNSGSCVITVSSSNDDVLSWYHDMNLFQVKHGAYEIIRIVNCRSNMALDQARN